MALRHRAWVFLSTLIILGTMYENILNKVPMIVLHITNTCIVLKRSALGMQDG